MDDLIRRSDAIDAMEELSEHYTDEGREWHPHIDFVIDELIKVPAVEPNLILPERMERGDVYDVGETITVMNHEDYMDMICKAMMWDEYEKEPKHGEWIDKGWRGDWQFETDGRGNCWHEYECSECGFCSKGSKSNYCPNCGTKMKGVEDE